MPSENANRQPVRGVYFTAPGYSVVPAWLADETLIEERRVEGATQADLIEMRRVMATYSSDPQRLIEETTSKAITATASQLTLLANSYKQKTLAASMVTVGSLGVSYYAGAHLKLSIALGSLPITGTGLLISGLVIGTCATLTASYYLYRAYTTAARDRQHSEIIVYSDAFTQKNKDAKACVQRLAVASSTPDTHRPTVNSGPTPQWFQPDYQPEAKTEAQLAQEEAEWQEFMASTKTKPT